MNPWQSLFTKAIDDNQLKINDACRKKLLTYLELLQKWNRVFNLTSITDPRDMVYLHLIDSLMISPFLHGDRLLDVGTGAGLPGIPLAIIHPQQQWVLLDKNSKKTRFLTQAIAELELANSEIMHARCENFHPTLGFSSILSRAFGTLRLFVETTEHLLDKEGILIAMKGKYPQDELNNVPDHFCVKSVDRILIKGAQIDRHVVCLTRKK